MQRFFRAAKWSPALKGISLLGSVILLGIPVLFSFLEIERSLDALRVPGFILGYQLFLLFLGGTWVACLFFTVQGYSYDGRSFRIQRLGFSTTLPTARLKRVQRLDFPLGWGLKTFGNGGLFSFSGWFYFKNLGHVRLFVTDWKKAVLLETEQGKKIIVSPEDPEGFVQEMT